MARNPKLFIHGKCYFVTTRILQGLPLIPNQFMTIVLESILARAQELYNVHIAGLIVMGNHVHIIFVVEDPSCVDSFMRYFKTESAHAINRMLGRRKGPLWEEGYDSPILLDRKTLIEKLVYIYINPQLSHLVDSIDNYPGLSSWGSLVDGTSEFETCRFNRRDFRRLPRKMSNRQKRAYADELIRISEGRSNSYKINLRAAYDAYPGDESFEEFKDKIKNKVRSCEKILKILRAKSRKGVLGAAALKKQSMHKPHNPKKWGKRTICLGSTREIRAAFISFFKSLREESRLAYKKISSGYSKSLYPPGFCMPGGIKLADILPIAFFRTSIN